LSAGSVIQNTQVPNNPPGQAAIGNKSVNEGQWLNFTVQATDPDSDPITYGTNSTKGNLILQPVISHGCQPIQTRELISGYSIQVMVTAELEVKV